MKSKDINLLYYIIIRICLVMQSRAPEGGLGQQREDRDTSGSISFQNKPDQLYLAWADTEWRYCRKVRKHVWAIHLLSKTA